MVAAVFSIAFDSHRASLHLASATRQALDAQRAQLAGARVPPGLKPATRAALRRAIDASFVSGFRVAMGVSAALTVVAGLVALVLIPGRTTLAPASALTQSDHAAANAGRRIVTGQA